MGSTLRFTSLLAAGFLSLCGTANASCLRGTSLYARDMDNGGGARANYSWTGTTGPLDWADLDPSFSLCAKGKNQSPINIDNRIPKVMVDKKLQVEFFQMNAPAKLQYVDSSLEVPLNGTMFLNNQRYELRQAHFHTPGEHFINGEHYPMELHFVWEMPTNKSLAIMAFVLDIGPSIRPFLYSMLSQADELSSKRNNIATRALNRTEIKGIMTNGNAYGYYGSLPMPPCTENVAWIVYEEPLMIDQETYRKVKKILKFNSRYLQNSLGQENLLANQG